MPTMKTTAGKRPQKIFPTKKPVKKKTGENAQCQEDNKYEQTSGVTLSGVALDV